MLEEARGYLRARPSSSTFGDEKSIQMRCTISDCRLVIANIPGSNVNCNE